MVILGKSLAGGVYPVSCVLADDKVMNPIKPGEHGSTWGGNPLAAAVATAGLEVILEEKLTENSYNLGIIFKKELDNIFGKRSWMREVRGGRGLYGGLLISDDLDIQKLVHAFLKNNLIVYAKGKIVRLIPPLVMNEKELYSSLE